MAQVFIPVTAGQVIFSNRGVPYQLTDILGEGQYSDVWRAFRLSGGQQVAIKFTNGTDRTGARPSLTHPSFEYLQSMQREHGVFAALRGNPYFVHKIGSTSVILPGGRGASGSILTIAPGQNLKSMIRSGETDDLQTALKVSKSLLDAICEAHDDGVVHLDIKPANINWDGQVTLFDYGFAHLIDDPNLAVFPKNKSRYGSPGYMSPEHADEATGWRSPTYEDMYCAAVVIFEMLSAGERTHGRKVWRNIMQAKIYSTARCINEARESVGLPTVSDSLAAFVEKTLEGDPYDRFRTAIKMREAFLQVDEFVQL